MCIGCSSSRPAWGPTQDRACTMWGSRLLSLPARCQAGPAGRQGWCWCRVCGRVRRAPGACPASPGGFRRWRRAQQLEHMCACMRMPRGHAAPHDAARRHASTHPRPAHAHACGTSICTPRAAFVARSMAGTASRPGLSMGSGRSPLSMRRLARGAPGSCCQGRGLAARTSLWAASCPAPWGALCLLTASCPA